MFAKSTKLALLLNISSNLIAQIIAIAFIPILARLYSPADFGNAYIFLAVCSCLVAVSSFRFAVTVPLAENNYQRNLGIVLSASIIVLLFIFLTFLLLFSPFKIFKQLEGVEPFLVAYFLFASINNLLTNVVIATGKYKNIGLAKMSAALTLNFSRLVIVFVGFSDGLIYSLVFSEVVVLLVLLRACKAQLSTLKLGTAKYEHLKKYIQLYKDYPKYQIPSQLILLSTQYAPAFLLPITYSASEVGIFAMANNLVSLPVNSIGVALSQIYLGEFRKKENRPKMLKYSILVILFFTFCSFVAMLLFHFYGGELVTIFLGKQWGDVVPITILLMALGAAKLCIAVVSQSLNILGKQKLQLFINIIYLGFSFFSLIWAIESQMTFIESIFIYAISSTCGLIIGLLLIILNIWRGANEHTFSR